MAKKSTKAKAKPQHIKAAKVRPVAIGGVTAPAITFEGDQPEAGQDITVKLENGVTYRGTVLEAHSVEQMVTLTLTDGLTPTK